MRREGISLPDFLVLASGTWSVLALWLHHGASTWQFAGITALELIGPYYIARKYVTSPEAVQKVVRGYFFIVAALVPIAVYETVTGHFIVRDLARSVLPAEGDLGRPGRLGLERAYVSFEHPIHYGVFVAALTGMAMALAGKMLSKILRYAVLLIGTFCSLSTGPLMVFIVQTQLLVWDLLTRQIRYRWHALAGLVVLAYVIVDIISNRTPFHVLVTYFSLRLVSAYNRIIIWNYGIQNVADNPIFGIGQAEWERPIWLHSSIDNYWLVIAIRYGLPAFLFLAAAILIILRRAARAEHGGEGAQLRKGWLISMIGLIIAGGTVHYWSAIGCLFLFVVGMGYCFNRPARSVNGEKHSPRRGMSANVQQFNSLSDPGIRRMQVGKQDQDAAKKRSRISL